MPGVPSVNILGSLECRVDDDGSPVALGARPAVVLALLAAQPGEPMSRERLIDGVWDGDPPDSARVQIAMAVSAVRKECREPDTIETVRSGYRLHPSVATDLATAEALTARARRDSDPELFRLAVRQWRGPILPELSGGGAVEDLRRRLTDRRLVLLESWAELEKASDPELVDLLAQAVAEHPLREILRVRLMQQLWLGGRAVEALDCYRDGRRRLIDEVGVEPGHELRELHDRILSGEPPTSGPAAPTRIRPSQLPPAISAFAGRAAEVASLDGMVSTTTDHLPIAVLSGIAGVGKTTVAVQWAHRVADHFADGQLYADLRGYDDQASPASADEILERFLIALGEPVDRIPADREQRAAHYRSLLRDRSVLVVLDNAASSRQVQPLLPGHAACMVIVTARTRLPDLIARNGALSVPVEPFVPEESAQLLRKVVGEQRVRMDRDGAGRLAGLCSGLPLALSIAAARVVARPGLSLGRMAARMSREQDRLDLLHGEHDQVRGAFAMSYRQLEPLMATAFRRLGLVHAPGGIAPWLLAALIDEPDLGIAESMLEDLVDAQMVQQLGTDALDHPRYRLHDLIRLFARECAEADESADERSRALDRANGALLALTELAAQRFRGAGGLEEVHSDFPRWLPNEADDLLSDPMTWLGTERLNLTSSVRDAARTGEVDLCWDLTVTGSILHRRCGYHEDQRVKYQVALPLCRSVDDVQGEAALLLMHNDFHVRRGEMVQAAENTRRARDVFSRLGDRRTAALASVECAVALRVLGEWDAALAAFDEADALLAADPDASSSAYAGYQRGLLELNRHRAPEAEALARRGLDVAPADAHEVRLHLMLLKGEALTTQQRHPQGQEIGLAVLQAARDREDQRLQAQALLLLSSSVRPRSRDRALSVARQALDLSRDLGDRLLEGRSLLAIAVIDPATHGRRLEEALAIFEEQDYRVWAAEARALRQKSPRDPDATDTAILRIL